MGAGLVVFVCLQFPFTVVVCGSPSMELWPEGVQTWYERLRCLCTKDVELRVGTGARFETLARVVVKNEFLDIEEIARAPPPLTWLGGETLRKKEIDFLERLIKK